MVHADGQRPRLHRLEEGTTDGVSVNGLHTSGDLQRKEPVNRVRLLKGCAPCVASGRPIDQGFRVLEEHQIPPNVFLGSLIRLQTVDRLVVVAHRPNVIRRTYHLTRAS